MVLHIIKDKKTNKELENKYNVPIRTLQNWEKTEFFLDSWQGGLYRNLKVYNDIEKIVLEQLKTLFKKNELKALIASINGTMESTEFYSTKEVWAYHFTDSCIYESMQITQFLEENETLDLLKKSVSNKLLDLDTFSKYVLMQYCYDFWQKEGIDRNIDNYVK